ncbi:hypothetical protein EROP_19880 [Erysipelotrichaceae bacterium OPF54]|nr:hypothetical protein EROP_19880 [Erysipelotrichaceae bacterium OPF54]
MNDSLNKTVTLRLFWMCWQKSSAKTDSLKNHYENCIYMLNKGEEFKFDLTDFEDYTMDEFVYQEMFGMLE